MKKYWFYLEPFTFIFPNKQELLLYNSMSYNCKVFRNTFKLKKLVTRLKEVKNMYCVDLSKEDLKDYNVKNFINYACDTFSGDLINSDLIQKPIIFPPIPKLQFSFKKLENTYYRSFGDEIFEILKEVSIILP